MSDAASPGPATGRAKAPASGVRRRAIGIALTVIVVLAIAYGLYWLLIGSRYVETDNAYVGADSAQVTPLVSGAVKTVLARETQWVHAGDPLVVIDPADARLEVAQASAELGKSERRVEQYEATDTNLAAQLAARDADITHAKAQLVQARSNAERTGLDLHRRESVAATGAISQEELTSARDSAATAQANLAAAEAALAQALANRKAALAQQAVNAALLNGATAATNPEVLSSKAKLGQSQLDLERTVLRAPISGVVTKRQVQVGQKVQSGAVLMSIAPIDQAYVDANFKEVQLRKVRVGQSVTLTSDLYGDDVKYHGRVVGFSGGTGSSLAVIPAQNATGNWIKVVQRLAVRIAIAPKDLRDHPLRIGLSMKARIDTATSG